MRALSLAAVLVAAPVAAAPVASYNQPVAPSVRAPLVGRIEQLVAEVATRERREAPRPDARLEHAAEDIVRVTALDGRPPNEVVQAALWLNGIVEPPPHLILATMGQGGDDGMLAELRNQLPPALAQGKYRRVGAAARTIGDSVLVLVALQESALELEPMPRALPNGGPTPIRGKLRAPYERPEAFVTAPDGKVTKLPLDGDATRFAGTFHCGPERGRYQLELGGEDRFGAAVLANFPIYCGVPAPAALPRPGAQDGDKLGDAQTAEREVARLVNADRARAGLPPIELDGKLSQVARGHSEDMAQHGFVGHVSPSTGTAADRLRKAGVDAALILENVARAYSPGEAERGLMDSPGHRANILNREVTRVGVGAVVTDGVGGAKELLLTQVFVKPAEALQPTSARELRRALEDARHKRKLQPLGEDPALDRLASEAVRAFADGKQAGESMERALSGLAPRYRSVRSVGASGGSLLQLASSLEKDVADAHVTTVGIGLAQGRYKGSAALFAVLVLAEHR